MKTFQKLFLISILLFTIFSCNKNENQCEEWGYFDGHNILWPSLSYISAYSDFNDQKISKEAFKKKAEQCIKDIKDFEKRLNKKKVCEHSEDKYAKNKDILLNTVSVVIPIMVSGEYLAPSLIDFLKDEKELKNDKKPESNKKTNRPIKNKKFLETIETEKVNKQSK